MIIVQVIIFLLIPKLLTYDVVLLEVRKDIFHWVLNVCSILLKENQEVICYTFSSENNRRNSRAFKN